MVEQRVQRRLAAILAADVAGYSPLMGADEEGTLERLKAHRGELLDPKIKEHRGRIVKTTGDGLLAEFASVVDALHCATEIQRGMVERNAEVAPESRIALRVGINVGDIVVEGDDIYGDGVNVAARLEGLAEPGGICVSGRVQEDVRGKLQITFEDLGEQKLKNIAWPVRIYRVQLGVVAASSGTLPTLSDMPSIAVLPFENMSGDPEQSISVTASRRISLRTCPRFRRSRSYPAIPSLHSKVSEPIQVRWLDNSMCGMCLRGVCARRRGVSAIETRPTQNSESYQRYLLARYHFERRNRRGLEITIRFCRRALEIDPDYARAWALIALCQAIEYKQGKSEESGLPAAEKALSIDPTLANAYAAKGRVLAELGRYDDALAAHAESLRLEPDSYDVRYHFGITCLVFGWHDQAIEHLERAAQLLEMDSSCLALAALSYEALGRHDEAIGATRRAFERIQKAIVVHPDNEALIIRGAVALARLGEKKTGQGMGLSCPYD